MGGHKSEVLILQLLTQVKTPFELRLSGHSLKAATSESRTILAWPQAKKLLANLDQLCQ